MNDGAGADLGRQAGINRDDTQRADRGLDAAIAELEALFGQYQEYLSGVLSGFRDAVRGSTARLPGSC